ncbi:DUF72 domain-containing protein [Candidatus Bathyarchaeota archaeon]|nr:DUF72 domain-containing protein [Candidatus Bathyarchaeota archaeon]
MTLLLGTSGWSYDDWVGPFYTKKTGKFSQYAKIFHTVEINSTFYRYPSEGMIFGLQRNSPPGFLFSSKLPGLITHDKWLDLSKGVEDDTIRFLNLMRPLAESLGPILIQLRPKFNLNEHMGNLEDYLEVLPSNYEWAVEFRDNSWLVPETFDLLSQHNVAYTIVDEPLLPPELHFTADFSYIRWHGRGTNLWYDYEYSEEQLEDWVPKVEEIESKTRRTYGYFNNHFRANAVKNAVEFLDLLDKATPEQKIALDRIINHHETAGRPVGVQPLTSFTSDEGGQSPSDFLSRFMDFKRLARAEKIKDTEIQLEYVDEDRIEANIRNYHIIIDMNEQVIKHNCDDWRKGKSSKRMCKHIGKLFLTLPPGQAKDILSRIWDDIEGWFFEE